MTTLVSPHLEKGLFEQIKSRDFNKFYEFHFSISVIFCRVGFFFWITVGTLTYHKIKKITVLGEMTGRNGRALSEVKLVPEGGKGCTASIWLGSSKESPTSASQAVSLTHWPAGVLLQPRIRSCSLQYSACLAHKQCNNNQKKKPPYNQEQ